MRTAIYVRLSVDRTGDGLGVERQREDCTRLVDQRGWTLGRTFSDNDRSAAGRKPRPAFLALLAAIDAGDVDAVVAWALDRLARTARDRLALVEACQRRGVVIALVRGSDMDPTTPAGRLAIGILGEVAQHEIDAKGDRQRRAAEQAAEQGRWIGGRRPFGFEPDGVTVRAAEADAVSAGYAAVLAGVSLRAVAAEWNAHGLRTGQRPWRNHADGDDRGSRWRADAVRRVLLSPRYAGIRAHRGEERGPACWPAVVPEHTYRAAVQVLTDPARHTAGAGAAGRQFLTGLAVCAAHGCELTVHGGGAYHRKPVYRCRSEKLRGDDRAQRAPGAHCNRLAAPVDRYVERVALARLTAPDARDLLVDTRRPDVPALRGRATALRGRLDALAAEFGADPDTSPSEYRAMRAPIRAELTAIEAEVADAGRVDLLGPLVLADHAGDVWEALSLDRRRAVVDELMSVRLHPVGRGTRTFRVETVDIAWRRD